VSQWTFQVPPKDWVRLNVEAECGLNRVRPEPEPIITVAAWCYARGLRPSIAAFHQYLRPPRIWALGDYASPMSWREG
jgi:hypothetical protein